MAKRIYLLVGIGVVALAVLVMILGYYQKEFPSLPEVKGPSQQEIKEMTEKKEATELNEEVESFSQDILELEEVAEDKSLETLEEDMSAVSGEISLEEELPESSLFEVSEIERMEEEISTDLEGISSDLGELEEFEGDTSLNELEETLAGFTK